jgi:hypothetical protein
VDVAIYERNLTYCQKVSVPSGCINEVAAVLPITRELCEPLKVDRNFCFSKVDSH